VITKQPIRVVGDDPENGSPDWTLESDDRDRLHLTPGEKLKRWFTKTEYVTPPDDPHRLPQRNLITNGGGEADPTNHTWLHISTQQLTETAGPSDNIDGNISLRKTDSPYRQYLLLPTETELQFRAEFDTESIEFTRTLNGNGSSLTLPIKERQYLGVESGDTVEVYVDTKSLVGAQAVEYPEQQSPEYIPKEETAPVSTTDNSDENTSSTTPVYDDSNDSTSEAQHVDSNVNTDDTGSGPIGEVNESTTDESLSNESDSSENTTSTSSESNSTVETGSVSGDVTQSGDVEPDDSWRREESRYADRVTNIASTELVPIVLLSQRVQNEWPLHYTRSAESKTAKKTLCGEVSEDVYRDSNAELSTTLCSDCLLTAFRESPEKHIDKLIRHVTDTTNSTVDEDTFTLTTSEIIQLIEYTIE
jgi:hypothetical protein